MNWYVNPRAWFLELTVCELKGKGSCFINTTVEILPADLPDAQFKRQEAIAEV